MRPHQLNTDLIFTSDLVMFTRERNKSAYLSRANDARNKSFRLYICSQIAVNGKEGNIDWGSILAGSLGHLEWGRRRTADIYSSR